MRPVCIHLMNCAEMARNPNEKIEEQRTSSKHWANMYHQQRVTEANESENTVKHLACVHT
jgi:hypothetical protein